jgi:hypothetical protein
MKKLLFSLAVFSAITFAACSSDDDNGTGGSACRTCEIAGEDSYRVCRGTNGNAFVDDTDTGVEYGEYLDSFCG